MAPWLVLAFAAGVALIAYNVAASEPTDARAVTSVIFGAGISAFAIASAVLHYLPARLGRGRRRALWRTSLRRGFLVGLGVATLAFLRVVDALSAVTAAFVLMALAALEGVLSTRG